MKIISIIISTCLTLLLAVGCCPECQNGGICNNGTCDCPPGYSGSLCQNYNPCYNVTCQNGGVCNNGKCNCPPGYSGSQCQNYNPCYNVTCQNGGTCVNGNCNCPTGYYGSNCQFKSPCLSDNTGTISIDNRSASRFVYYLYVTISGKEVLQSSCNYGGTCNTNPLKVGVYAVSIKSSTGRVLCSSNLQVTKCTDNGKECNN